MSSVTKLTPIQQKINEYKALRTAEYTKTEEEHNTYFFCRPCGYSKTDKLTAADELFKVISQDSYSKENLKVLVKNNPALKQGRLGKIYGDCLNVKLDSKTPAIPDQYTPITAATTNLSHANSNSVPISSNLSQPFGQVDSWSLFNTCGDNHVAQGNSSENASVSIAGVSAVTSSFSHSPNSSAVNVVNKKNIKTEQELQELKKTFESQGYYQRLGLTSLATSSDIKKAYILLSRDYHPDSPTAVTTEGNLFSLIHDAYATLHDPISRKIYDMGCIAGIHQPPSQEQYSRSGTFTYNHNSQGIHNIHVSDNFVAIVDRGILLFNTKTGELFKTLQRPGSDCNIYYGTSIFQAANIVLATHSSGDIDVFDLVSGALTQTYKKINKFAGGGDVFKVEANKNISYDRTSLKVFNDNGLIIKKIPSKGINNVTVSPDHQFLLLASGKAGISLCGSVSIFNFAKLEHVKTLHANFPVYKAIMFSDCRIVAYCGYSPFVVLHDLKTGQIRKITTNAIHAVHTICISPNSQYLAIGEDQGFLVYSITEDRIVERRSLYGYIKNIDFVSPNRLVVNAYYEVLNIPLPSSILTSSNLLGAPVSAIMAPVSAIMAP